MPYELKLTRLADQDFDEILDYTLQTWGREQYCKYRDSMLAAFAAISNNPILMRSKARDDLHKGLRTYPTGRHYLIYRVSEHCVTVVRILHQQMDLPRHLESFH